MGDKSLKKWVLLMAVLLAWDVKASKGLKYLGQEGAWKAFASDRAGSRKCFIVSEPKEQKGQFTQRGKPHVMVTRDASKKPQYVVSVVAGYTYKLESEVEVRLADKVVALFTKDDTAWADSSASDAQIVQLFKQGKSAEVVGTSSRGNEIQDHYSLSGFSAALKMIDKNCSLSEGKQGK
jgi:hypothetical protein